MKLKGHLKPLVLSLMEREEEITGQQLAEEIEDKLGYMPSYGSMYPLLSRMEEDGLVESSRDGRSKNYTLTSKGVEARERLEEEKKQVIETITHAVGTYATLFHEDRAEDLTDSLREKKSLGSLQYPEIINIMRMLLSRDFSEEQKQDIREILRETSERIREI